MTLTPTQAGQEEGCSGRRSPLETPGLGSSVAGAPGSLGEAGRLGRPRRGAGGSLPPSPAGAGCREHTVVGASAFASFLRQGPPAPNSRPTLKRQTPPGSADQVPHLPPPPSVWVVQAGAAPAGPQDRVCPPDPV